MYTEHISTLNQLIATRLDVRASIEQKIQDFHAHWTQIAPDNFVLTLPEEVQQQWLGVEYVLLVRQAPTARWGEMETRLFTDLL